MMFTTKQLIVIALMGLFAVLGVALWGAVHAAPTTTDPTTATPPALKPTVPVKCLLPPGIPDNMLAWPRIMMLPQMFEQADKTLKQGAM